MIFPIPNRKALEAAMDLASDVRKLASEMLKLSEALSGGEGTPADLQNYEMLKAQMQSMSQIVFFCVETKKEFRVADYVTTRRTKLALERESKQLEAYSQIGQTLQ